MAITVTGRALELALRATPLVMVMTASDAELLTLGNKVTNLLFLIK